MIKQKVQTQQILSLSEKQEAERIEQMRTHRSKRGVGAQNRDVERDEFRDLRNKQMQEQQAELEKIIGKEKLEEWNDLHQDVRDENRAGRRIR